MVSGGSHEVWKQQKTGTNIYLPAIMYDTN